LEVDVKEVGERELLCLEVIEEGLTIEDKISIDNG
jgi:hypothetical protein